MAVMLLEKEVIISFNSKICATLGINFYGIIVEVKKVFKTRKKLLSLPPKGQ